MVYSLTGANQYVHFTTRQQHRLELTVLEEDLNLETVCSHTDMEETPMFHGQVESPPSSVLECALRVMENRGKGQASQATEEMIKCREYARNVDGALLTMELTELLACGNCDTKEQLQAIDLAADLASESCSSAGQAILVELLFNCSRFDLSSLVGIVDSLLHTVKCSSIDATLIETVGNLAFQRSFFESQCHNPDLQSIALLMYGALAGAAQDRIAIEGLERELGHFDRGRIRREAGKNGEGERYGPFGRGTAEEHHAFLLHALGNSRSPSSFGVIASYVNGSSVPTSLRSAGAVTLKIPHSCYDFRCPSPQAS